MATEESFKGATSDEAPASTGTVPDFGSLPELSMGAAKSLEIRIGKEVTSIEENGKQVDVEVFTMTLGNETIKLLPLRNWGQLDV